MALTPTNDPNDAEKRAQRAASEQNVLLREVDEAFRQDQLAGFLSRYGLLIGALVLAALLAFGGWLWWHEHRESMRETTSEEIVKASDQLEAGNLDTADKAFAAIEADAEKGAAVVAKLSRAGIAFEKGQAAAAAKLYAEVAADGSAPQPYRDFATIREISINYEKMKPAEVEKRLKPLATPGTPFFGSAGELLGAAYLDQGKNSLAGPLFAAIAKDKDVPASLRSRTRQLAGLLGVDAIDDVDKALEEMSVDDGSQGAQ